MTATQSLPPRPRPSDALGDRARRVLAAVAEQCDGLAPAGRLALLNAVAADLAAMHARILSPVPPAGLAADDAQPGLRVELTVSGYYPVTGEVAPGRFVAGEVFTLSRPMSAGDGDAALVVTADGRAARVPHSHLRLATAGGV